MADKKVSKMILKVDLDCTYCCKKIKKTLSKLQKRENIEIIIYDKLKKMINISGDFCPQKLFKILCCKACECIMEIEIVKEEPKKEKPKDDKPKKEDKKTDDKPTPPPHMVYITCLAGHVCRCNQDSSCKPCQKRHEGCKPCPCGCKKEYQPCYCDCGSGYVSEKCLAGHVCRCNRDSSCEPCQERHGGCKPCSCGCEREYQPCYCNCGTGYVSGRCLAGKVCRCNQDSSCKSCQDRHEGCKPCSCGCGREYQPCQCGCGMGYVPRKCDPPEYNRPICWKPTQSLPYDFIYEEDPPTACILM